MLLRVGPEVLDPGFRGVQGLQDAGDLLVRDEAGGLKAVAEQLQGLGHSGGTDRFGRAEPAVVAGNEVPDTLPGQLRSLPDLGLRPVQQLHTAQGLLADGLQPWLDDGHADRREVVELAELSNGAQAVEPELWVVHGVHGDP